MRKFNANIELIRYGSLYNMEALKEAASAAADKIAEVRGSLFDKELFISTIMELADFIWDGTNPDDLVICEDDIDYSYFNNFLAGVKSIDSHFWSDVEDICISQNGYGYDSERLPLINRTFKSISKFALFDSTINMLVDEIPEMFNSPYNFCEFVRKMIQADDISVANGYVQLIDDRYTLPGVVNF